MGKRKVRPEDKIESAENYLRGKGSVNSWSSALKIARSSFKDWVRIYQSHGPAGLQPKGRNTRYSKELKTAAVEAYLSGEGSQDEICKKYKIASRKQLRDWIKLYNDHKELGSWSGHGSEVNMTKGRKNNI